jgi:hypothetical protein
MNNNVIAVWVRMEAGLRRHPPADLSGRPVASDERIAEAEAMRRVRLAADSRLSRLREQADAWEEQSRKITKELPHALSSCSWGPAG